MSNVNDKKEMLEVEVIIPDEVLAENKELNRFYKKDKSMIVYPIATETTKELREKIKGLIQNGKTTDIVAFNPVLAALSFIQSFKDLKYDPEKKNEKDYTDSIAKIGKFNSAVTSVSKQIKDPLNQYKQIVIDIEKLLKEESDNVKKCLAENFKPYLDEKAKKEAEKQAKKDAEKNEVINKLSSENAENLNKLNNQKRETRKTEIESIISKVISDVSSKVPNLNEEGLTSLRETTLNQKLGEIDTPDIEFSPEEKTDFKKRYAEAVLNAVKIIDLALKGLESQKGVEQLKSENESLKAAFSVDDDFPEEKPAASITEEVVYEENDLGRFEFIVHKLEMLNDTVKHVQSEIEKTNFEDQGLNKVKSILLEKSMPSLVELSDKAVIWATSKQQQYINFLNSK